METGEQVIPRVSVGVEYGRYLADITVDALAIADHLRRRGFNDSRICETVVELSDAPEPYCEQIKDYIEGFYDDALATAFVYGIPKVMEAYLVQNEEVAESVNADLQALMLHELEHRLLAHDPKAQAAKRRFEYVVQATKAANYVVCGSAGVVVCMATDSIYNLMSLREASLLGVIISVPFALFRNEKLAVQAYDRNPEERRCRQAESATDRALLAFRIREEPQLLEYEGQEAEIYQMQLLERQNLYQSRARFAGSAGIVDATSLVHIKT